MPPTGQQSKAPKSKKRRPLLLRILRFTWRAFKTLVSGIILFLFLFWLLFKIPAVQNWLAARATDYLSKEWNTVVHIGKVDIRLFDHAIFEDVYIEDLNRDTLIYAHELTAYIDISEIVHGRLVITEAHLHDGLFQLQRLEGQEKHSLQFILDYFAPKDKKKKKKKPNFQLAINHIHAHEARFHMLDMLPGVEVDAYVQEGVIHTHFSNLLAQTVLCDSVHLEGAKVKVRVFPGSPVPSLLNKAPSDFVPPKWTVSSDLIRINGMNFWLLNEKMGIKPELPLDFNDLQLSNAAVLFTNMSLKNDSIQLHVNQLRGKERRGFELSSLHGDLLVSPNGSHLKNFELNTPYSTIGNELIFVHDEFPDFLDFIHKVKIKAKIVNSTVAMRDVMMFAAPLNDNPFFITNKNQVATLDCRFRGEIEDFSIRDITLDVADTHFEGELDLRPFDKFMYLKAEQLNSNYTDISTILAFTKIPVEISRLGNINFKGDYTGYFDNDFTAHGDLTTALGKVRADLKMNVRGGPNFSSYEGDLVFDNFDLGRLLQNPDFGLISAVGQLDGKGLTLGSINAEIKDSRIDLFEYKGHKYDTLYILGNFSEKRFEGSIKCNDPNFNVDVFGVADFEQEIPELVIFGQIGNIDFQCLNFTEDQFVLGLNEVKVRLKGNKIDNFEGELSLKDIDFTRNWGHFHLDYVALHAKDTVVKGDSMRVIHLGSDIVSADILGQYDEVNLPKSLFAFVEKNYPNFVRNIRIAQAKDSVALARVDSIHFDLDSLPIQRMNVNVHLHDSKSLTKLINRDFESIKGAHVALIYNSEQEAFSCSAEIEKLQWGGFVVENESLTVVGEKNVFKILNSVEKLQLNDTTQLPTPKIVLNGKGDTIHFNINIDKIGAVASEVSVNGKVSFDEKTVRGELDESGLTIFEQKWGVQGNNYIEFDFGQQKLKVNNLLIYGPLAYQRIETKSFGEKGLEFNARNIDLGKLYDIVKIPQFDIDGVLQAKLTVEDIFQQKKLKASILFDNLVINGDKWNQSTLEVKADSIKSPILGTFVHVGPYVDSLSANFTFIPVFAAKADYQRNRLNVNFDVQGADAHILDYFMTGVVSNTVGKADAKGRITGNLPRLQIRGDAFIRDMATTISFLNTRYSIPSGRMKLRPTELSFEPQLYYDENSDTVYAGGVPIYDQEGNRGLIGGRITHNNLKDWGIDLDLIFKRNLTLNTTADSDMPFYGKVYATGKANIAGPFTNLVMNIDAETNAGPNGEKSILVLPIFKPVEITEAVDYIVFKDMKAPEDSSSLTDKDKPKLQAGIEVNMKIKATPDAIAKILIDEKAGDVIEGRGSGDIELRYKDTEPLALFGKYEIEEGSYLFTYRNVINKPFSVRKGGTITWEGDPYNANINMSAVYRQETSLAPLLTAYNDELTASDKSQIKNVGVDVLMDMTGSLMTPDIKFGMDIPEKPTGRAGTLASLAIRAIQQDESKLNRQVFALIALQQFLPEESNVGGGINLGTASFNTLSEMLSQQLSRHIGDLLSEVVSDVGFISSVDFQFGLTLQDDQVNNTGTSSQLNVGLDQYFLKDKLRVHIGTNVDFANNNSSSVNKSYIGGDFIVEYAISESGNLKVRAYNRSESNIFGPRIRTGVGISYQREFETFESLFKEIASEIKTASEKRKAKKAKRKAEKEEVAGPIGN